MLLHTSFISSLVKTISLKAGTISFVSSRSSAIVGTTKKNSSHDRRECWATSASLGTMCNGLGRQTTVIEQEFCTSQNARYRNSSVGHPRQLCRLTTRVGVTRYSGYRSTSSPQHKSGSSIKFVFSALQKYNDRQVQESTTSVVQAHCKKRQAQQH